jgi:hypothetical protein
VGGTLLRPVTWQTPQRSLAAKGVLFQMASSRFWGRKLPQSSVGTAHAHWGQRQQNSAQFFCLPLSFRNCGIFRSEKARAIGAPEGRRCTNICAEKNHGFAPQLLRMVNPHIDRCPLVPKARQNCAENPRS